MDSVKSLIDSEKYAQALVQARRIRLSIRQILFENPKLKGEVITIRTDRDIFSEPGKIIITHMNGLFIDLLNLYKRTEMFYTYALLKRVSDGGSLREEDINLLTDTLVNVYNPEIKLVSSESDDSRIIFEDDVVDDHHNYLFKREIDRYFQDLNMDPKTSESLSELSQKRKEEILSIVMAGQEERRKVEAEQKQIENRCMTNITKEVKYANWPTYPADWNSYVNDNVGRSICSQAESVRMADCLGQEITSIQSVNLYNSSTV